MKRVVANRLLIFLPIVCAAVALDMASKHIVFADLGYPGGPRTLKAGDHDVFDHPELVEGESRKYLDGWVEFRLYTSFNPGALWGIGQDATAFFTVASFAAIAGILVWLFVFGGARSRWLTVSLALIMSGTLGNLWDRLALHGCTDLAGQPIHAVRDFFLFTFGGWNYPIFNFADAFLVSGAIMLVVQSVFFVRAEEPLPSEGAAAQSVPAPHSSPATRTAERVSAAGWRS